MVPYFEEYCQHIIEKNPSFGNYALRISCLNKVEKNIFDMSAEEIADAVEADKKKITTLNALYGVLCDYYRWVNKTYDLSIKDSFYEVNRLKSIVSNIKTESGKDEYFTTFSELKQALTQAEEDYLILQESELSEKMYESLVVRQKKFNVFNVFLWEQLTTDDMISITLSDARNIISTKQLTVNGKSIELSDEEIQFIDDLYSEILELQAQDEQNSIKRQYKRKTKNWTYDNLFNSEKKSSFVNLKWNAMGASIQDVRLEAPNVKKAGMFNKMYQYERKNDYVFSGDMNSAETYARIFNTSVTKAYRMVSEYNKFRQSIENAEN